MKKIKLTKKQFDKIIEEQAVPVGLNITMGVHKQDGKENQDYYKEFGKKMDDYYKPLEDTEEENAESVMKYSYDEKADEYHNEYEILNGQEMLRYMNDPDERFKERAKEAIEGSSNMGNNPEWANVVTADQAGFTGPEFGKKLVDRIKSREEKYMEEDKLEKYDGMGDVAIPGAGRGEERKLAIAENKDNTENKKTMKRLRFKKPFNGVENALNLIPESYKVNNKTFQMTDGNENYEIRWEGSLNEGKATILKASDKTLMNEDMQRIKELFNFDSRKTLGTLKGKERLNEDKQFSTIWEKTQNISEMTGGFGFTGEGNLEGNTPMIDEEEKIEEDAKPDFLDLDGDGDTEEPMKKAAKEKEEEEQDEK
jgi:phosphoglycolate phosphatase-like HAD superfamily hydrolase